MDAVPGGAAFTDSVWMVGYATAPQMSYIGFNPNQGAFLRLLAKGKVATILMNTESLVHATQKHGPLMENLNFFDEMGRWTEKELKQYADAKVPIYACTQSAGELLYVPQGWVVVESTRSGEGEVYGIRKSVLHCSGRDSLTCYKATLKLLKASGRSSERTSAVQLSLKGQNTPL